ncbi:MAG: endonuclease/exonuclease/phosphatase family protein [Caldisericaceae bacterium]
MRIITWNVRRANSTSLAWSLLLELKPDIALLQEVKTIREQIYEKFDILSKVAISKIGKPQSFLTALLVKGKITREIQLKSEYDWVNRELGFFKGNIISGTVVCSNGEELNVVSVYCPAWPINKKRLEGFNVSAVKLKENPDVWATEIIWSALKHTISKDEQWVVGGDFNISETFDKEWQENAGIKFALRSSGNKEILDRMYAIGFKECLRGYNKEIVPTFQNPKDKKLVHQIDHLFVTSNLYSRLKECKVGDKSRILGGHLSDHLPIIADFEEF